MNNMALSPSSESKMRSPDRILELEVIDGKSPRTNMGMTDVSLFTGDNKLHAKMDNETTLWGLQYEKGVVPEPLKQKFTSFKTLKRFAEDYFLKRNVRIKEIKD